MKVVTVETRSLGDRSYLVHDGSVGLVIDPQRDVDRMEHVLADAGVTPTHVAETHMHNDYVSGGRVLVERHGAAHLVNAGDAVRFERQAVQHGDKISVGEMVVEVVDTPGHTAHHTSYVVSHDGEQAAFSGGNLLFGSVGRTDLVDPARTVELTRAQYRSAQVLAERAGDAATLYPTHGFGSLCAAGTATVQATSTIGEQRRVNHALSETDEQRFVERLIAGLGDYPRYYAHVGPINLVGGTAPDLSVPEPVDPAELRRRLLGGHSVVDLRNRAAFAGGHLAGSLGVEYGQSFTTYMGWLLPRDQPLTLIGPREQVEAAIRDLSRIGIDSPDAALGEDVAALGDGQPVVSFPRVGWPEVVHGKRDGLLDVLLDVRRDDEFTASHVSGAAHVPLHDLPGRLDAVPPGRVWVHCASGYRALIAAAMLQRAGRDVVYVDANLADAAEAGFELAGEAIR